MGAQERANEMGIDLASAEFGYLNLCTQVGSLLMTSGHTSDVKGMLGRDRSVSEGYEAARDCGMKVLRSVHRANGTLNGLRVVKVLGCVWSAPDFTEHPLVVNGVSDLFHELFGARDAGFHARSALGFSSLPNGASVEVEAIFEVTAG